MNYRAISLGLSKLATALQVSGCMQLHGPAKSLQMAQMSHENRVTRQVGGRRAVDQLGL